MYYMTYTFKNQNNRSHYSGSRKKKILQNKCLIRIDKTLFVTKKGITSDPSIHGFESLFAYQGLRNLKSFQQSLYLLIKSLKRLMVTCIIKVTLI